MIRVYRIRLNRQGYNSAGAYYGTGAPVYMIEPDGLPDSVTLRAPDAKTARARYMAAAEFGPSGVAYLHAWGTVPRWHDIARVGTDWLRTATA